MATFGAFCYDLIHGDPKALTVRRTRGRILLRYAVFFVITAALAAPQLFGFTFAQAFQEGSHSFITLQFNWVNNPSGQGMRDLYLWFSEARMLPQNKERSPKPISDSRHMCDNQVYDYRSYLCY